MTPVILSCRQNALPMAKICDSKVAVPSCVPRWDQWCTIMCHVPYHPYLHRHLFSLYPHSPSLKSIKMLKVVEIKGQMKERLSNHARLKLIEKIASSQREKSSHHDKFVSPKANNINLTTSLSLSYLNHTF